MSDREWITNCFWGNIDNPTVFSQGMRTAISQVIRYGGVFASDNLFAFGKNLSFLDDKKFIDSFNKHINNEIERGIIWRYYVLCWAAKESQKRDGDFVECACYKGTSARIVVDYVDFNNSGKSYYLYDLFEQPEGSRLLLEEHSESLYEQVKGRFSDAERVIVTRGRVPEILSIVSPETIAFLHLDLNDVGPELAALKLLFERVVPGGIIILDDYGWSAYREQKLAEDAYLKSIGYSVLELPTGQGLLIK